MSITNQTQSIFETDPLPPRLSRFTLNRAYIQNGIPKAKPTSPSVNQFINEENYDNSILDEPVPSLRMSPIAYMPNEDYLKQPSLYTSSCQILRLHSERQPQKKSPPSIPFIFPPQGIFGEYMFSIFNSLWNQFGPTDEDSESPYIFKNALTSSTSNSKKRKFSSPKSSSTYTFCVPLSWLILPNGRFLLAHPLSDILTQYLNLTQPINTSKSVAMSLIRLQISLKENLISSHRTLTSILADNVPLLVSPPMSPSTSSPSSSNIVNSQQAIGYRFTSSSSPLIFLYIAFSCGNFEVWQYGPPFLRSYSKPGSNVDSSNKNYTTIDTYIADTATWRKLHQVNFSTPVRWFDLNSTETSICIISGQYVYHSFTSNPLFELQRLPLHLSSGFRYPTSMPACAVWVDLNRLVLLNYGAGLRFLSLSSDGKWSCNGYLNLSLPTQNKNNLNNLIIPRIEYNPLLNVVYMLYSSTTLMAIAIPSIASLMKDISINPIIIRFPIKPNNLLHNSSSSKNKEISSNLMLVDFTIDKSSGGNYLAVLHKDSPFIRVYMHAQLDPSKTSLNLYASLIAYLDPPFFTAIPSSMSFSPVQSYSRSLLAVCWKSEDDYSPNHIQSSKEQLNQYNITEQQSKKKVFNKDIDTPHNQNNKNEISHNNLVQTCLYMLPITKQYNKDDKPWLGPFLAKKDKKSQTSSFLPPQYSYQQTPQYLNPLSSNYHYLSSNNTSMQNKDHYNINSINQIPFYKHNENYSYLPTTPLLIPSLSSPISPQTFGLAPHSSKISGYHEHKNLPQKESKNNLYSRTSNLYFDNPYISHNQF